MKISQIIQETGTTAGSVAPVQHGFVKMQTRNPSVYGGKKVGNLLKGQKTSKPFANSVNESADLSETDLSEQDLIVVPGQGRLKKSGFVKHDPDKAEHEGETLKNSLHTIVRVASHLDKELSVRANFPEWVSEKIGAVKSDMVSVMDYIISSKEMQGMAESDDPWGPQGNFAGDTKVDVGGVTMKNIQVDDTVTYLGQKATVVDMSKNRKYSRITISRGMGGVTQDVLTSDLEQLGQGIAEASLSQMRDYFSQQDSKVSRNYATPVRKQPQIGVPPGIQALVNKMYQGGNITPAEREYLRQFQERTKMDVGIKEGWKEKVAGAEALGGGNAMANDTLINYSQNKPITTASANNGPTMYEERTEVKDKDGKVISWKDETEWHKIEKNKKGQQKNPRGVVTHLSDVARRKTEKQDTQEGKIDFAKKIQKNVDKSNTAVVKTNREIGSRIADIGPGGKEYNVKTDKAWDDAQKAKKAK